LVIPHVWIGEYLYVGDIEMPTAREQVPLVVEG